MAVNTTTNRIAYTGNGVTTVFAYDFRTLAAEDIKVYVNAALVASGYTVSGVGAPGGGNVTFSVAPADGASVVITRELTYTQPVSTVDNATVLASFIDNSLDRATMQIQQVRELSGRAVRIPITDTNPALELPPQNVRANKYLYFDANGSILAVSVGPDTIYYGASASDPATRPGGTPSEEGDIYFNTAVKELRTFNGATWQSSVSVLVNDATTNEKLADMPPNTVKVRAASTEGNPSDLAIGASQIVGRGETGDLTALSLGAGLSMTGTTLRAGSTWVAPADPVGLTSVLFASIPDSASEVIVQFQNVSLSGTNDVLVQIGPDAGVVTTGYGSQSVLVGGTNSATGVSSTSGMIIGSGLAAGSIRGEMRLSRMSGTNTWVQSHAVGRGISGGAFVSLGGGSIQLGASLNRVQVRTSGTDTFDAGQIAIGWR